MYQTSVSFNSEHLGCLKMVEDRAFPYMETSLSTVSDSLRANLRRTSKGKWHIHSSQNKSVLLIAHHSLCINVRYQFKFKIKYLLLSNFGTDIIAAQGINT